MVLGSVIPKVTRNDLWREYIGPMIERVRIKGYRALKDVDFRPAAGKNVLVGDNESGKSTVLEAMALALTGRIHGRSAQDVLNPYWFNQGQVQDFFVARTNGDAVKPPEISIELFLRDDDSLQPLVGVHNSLESTTSCPGLTLRVLPDPEYGEELEHHLADSRLIPTEYYMIDWRDFGDNKRHARPKSISAAIIDSRTIRSFAGVDYHLSQILGDHLEPSDKAKVSVAFRAVKETMSDTHLAEVNLKLADDGYTLGDEVLGLAMDQSRSTSWDSQIVPHVNDIPFAMSGQGQQAVIKIALAIGRNSEANRILMIEEPENHLSHTTLNRLTRRIELESHEGQQYFITTHNSFVLNRLGLDSLTFVSEGGVSRPAEISEDSVRYFQRQPGHDTLRMVLAKRCVLVEGPSDEIVFEKLYQDICNRRPIEDGVDVICLRGTSFLRGLELSSLLGKKCAAVRDNDGKTQEHWSGPLTPFLKEGQRELFVGDIAKGQSLEPQLVSANESDVLLDVLKLDPEADLLKWMGDNKTEAAIRIAESSRKINAPEYLAKAIEFVTLVE